MSETSCGVLRHHFCKVKLEQRVKSGAGRDKKKKNLLNETELTASVLGKKNPKHTKDLKKKKNAFFNKNWTIQDKTCKFSRKSSFSSYVQYKNRKPINATHLVSDLGGWRKEIDRQNVA